MAIVQTVDDEQMSIIFSSLVSRTDSGVIHPRTEDHVIKLTLIASMTPTQAIQLED